MGYDDVFWFEKGAECGNDYLSFVAGISNDFLQNRIIDLNAGAGAGLLYHIGESRYNAGTLDYRPGKRHFSIGNYFALLNSS